MTKGSDPWHHAGMREVDLAAEVLSGQQSAIDRAYEYVAAIIDLKQVPEGGMLPRAEVLAGRAGVSRPSVLAALNLLKAQGLINVGPGRAGVRVSESVGAGRDARVRWVYDHRDIIRQMALLRTMVDPGVARLAAEHGLREEFKEDVHRLHHDMCGPILHTDGYMASDTEFHRLLAECSDAPVLIRLSLLTRRWVAVAFDLFPWPPHSRESSNAEHSAILAAVEAGDPDAAEKATREHLAVATPALLTLISNMEMRSKPQPSERDS